MKSLNLYFVFTITLLYNYQALSQCNINIPSNAVIGSADLGGSGSNLRWLCENDVVSSNGGGSNTYFIEDGGIVNSSGGGSHIIYVKNGGKLNIEGGGGSISVFYESNAIINNNLTGGGSNTFNLCQSIIFNYSSAPSSSCNPILSTGEIDIKLNGIVSAENNQIKNVANPTESLDAVNLGFLTEKLNELTQKINELESLIDSPQVQPPSEYVLSFDANNYVRFPNIDNYDNLDSMTIEFWAYLNSSPCTDESIIGTEYFATGWHFYPGMWAMIGGPNNAEAISNVDAHGSCENYIESSKWFHIALQYNSELNENQWKLYIDGDLHEQKTGNISSIGDGGDIVINRHTWDSGSSSRLSGYIDEVRFSKIARYSGNFTPEIKQLQNDENTLLLLNFENTTSNQVIDSSTNQNHGIINGTVNYVLRNDIEDSNAAN